MRIALLDYIVTPNNAVGNCDRIMLEGLCEEHTFTVFAVEFDNPNPQRIDFVRIPAPKHPLFLMYLVYFLLSPLYLFVYKRRHHVKFDMVQGIESISLASTVAYSHFCHRAYLQNHWNATKPTGARRYARWLNHQLFAQMEPLIYRRVREVVVPSQGLARELVTVYGKYLSADRIRVISNPVKAERMRRDPAFDSSAFRKELGLAPDDLVLVFIALGHFERKGLPMLLEGMAQSKQADLKLIVIGGSESMIESYRARSAALGIGAQVVFVGLQKDIRPYLWSSDLFAFPSSYEVFPLVSLEAAAAGLPLLTTPLYGIEEFLVDGVNGWCVERNADAIAQKLRVIRADRSILAPMGQAAAQSITRYSNEAFIENWRRFLATAS